MITERELNIEEAYNRLTRLHHHLGLQSKTALSKRVAWSPHATYTTAPTKKFLAGQEKGNIAN